mmetsp:Transcript_18695/g.34711  ORF Transcript_18695/g.34711 Transcript_18695/m.34711 type:complete len:209 (-) Transcript_18695:357-983(-)
MGSFLPSLIYFAVALSCSSCATFKPVMMMSTSIASNSLSLFRVEELGWTILRADRNAATRHDARASSTNVAPTARFLRRFPNSATSARSYRSELSRKLDPRPVVVVIRTAALSLAFATASDESFFSATASSSSAKLSNSSAASTELNPTKLAHKWGRLLAKNILSVPRLTSSPVREDRELRASFLSLSPFFLSVAPELIFISPKRLLS